MPKIQHETFEYPDLTQEKARSNVRKALENLYDFVQVLSGLSIMQKEHDQAEIKRLKDANHALRFAAELGKTYVVKTAIDSLEECYKMNSAKEAQPQTALKIIMEIEAALSRAGEVTK
jgi:hypothetical protein